MGAEVRADKVGFQEVDGSGLADKLVQAMRETATWPAVVDVRARTWDALVAAPAGGTVVDVGCGLADVLIEVKAARPDLRCVGVDVSVEMLRAAAADAAARGVEIELEPGSAVALPFEDGTVDVVRAERVLQWVDEPVVALRELLRVVRPGGSLVALDTDWRTMAMELDDDELEREAARVVASRPSAGIGGKLRNLFLDLGLDDVREHASTAVVAGWDPDERPAPPGFLPTFALEQVLVEAGMAAPRAAAVAAAYDATARRGRFHVSTSLFAVTGRKPT